MLCGACWQETNDEARCSACGQTPLLDGRYRLDARLGQGAAGIAFAATRVSDGARVCIKGLAFRGMSSFEAERLFHREAAVLKQIRHPQVPAYVDDFALGQGPSFTLYLVQELVVGEDLEAERMKKRPTVAEVVAIADELLAIVEHLHGLAPPIVHRDIKPKNIMRRADDRRLVLVDFGSVKEVIHASFDPGLSVQGTFGYMAPEQLRGEASPRSDLYAIGMVAVSLLSGREPTSFMDAEHVVRWQGGVAVDERLRAWLERMTAPAPDDRFASAAEARRALEEATRARPVSDLASPAPRPVMMAAPAFEVPDAPPPEAKRDSHGLRVFVMMGILVLTAVVAWVIVASRDDATAFPEKVARVRPDPCGGPCRPLSTPFKEQLAFGMTLDEARAARPDVAQAASVDGPDTQPSGWSSMPRAPHDGQRVCMSSEVIGQEGRCCLDFWPGLGRILCATEHAFPRGTLLELVDKVAGVYGNPARAPDEGHRFGFENLYDAIWESDGARLEISYKYVFDLHRDDPAVPQLDARQRLVVTHTSSAWNQEVARRDEALRRSLEAARAEEEARRRRELEAQREEREKLNLPEDPL